MIKIKSVVRLALLLSIYYCKLSDAVDVWPQVTTTPPICEDDCIGDAPNLLTISRLSQSLADAPSGMTVIDRENIRASGIVDLPEIFRLVPGFYVGVNACYVQPTNHPVSYHGMTSAYSGSMQVLFRGRSVYSPLYGGLQWSELPIVIADIERIEITRGPNAASYGANPFFGVINNITQQLNEAATNSITATHENGRNEAFYRHPDKIGDVNYLTTTGYSEDKGIDGRPDFKHTRLLKAQADYRLNESNTLEFEFGIVDGARGEGNLDKDNILFLPRTKQIDNHNELVRWRHNISEDSDFSLQVYHSYDPSDDDANSTNLHLVVKAIVLQQQLDRGRSLAVATSRATATAATLLSDSFTIFNDFITERSDIEAQHNFAIGKILRVVWGGSVRQDTMYAPHYLETDKTNYFSLERLFGHVEWQAHEKLVFNLGAMVKHNDLTGTYISPRESVNSRLNSNYTLRFRVSTALRTPNYVEEKFNRRLILPANVPLLGVFTVDKGNVDPEHITSRGNGYLGKVGRLSLDTRIFNDDIHDYIQTVKRNDFIIPAGFIPVIGRPTTSQNGGNLEIKDFETQTKWHISKDTNLPLNYTYVKICDDAAELDRDITHSMPRSTINALLTHRITPQWHASAAYYQTGEVTQLGDGDSVALTRGTDVRLVGQFA